MAARYLQTVWSDACCNFIYWPNVTEIAVTMDGEGSYEKYTGV